jgi:septal ring factor EnvC (AmiA/AmiB activator)
MAQTKADINGLFLVRVALGEIVGRLADPPEEEIAGVYFEIRESRVSVDPRGWLR